MSAATKKLQSFFTQYKIVTLLFAIVVIWRKWGLPDPTGLGVVLGLIGYSILIERYKHLSERQPDIAESLLASPSGAALFASARRRGAGHLAARGLGVTAPYRCDHGECSRGRAHVRRAGYGLVWPRSTAVAGIWNSARAARHGLVGFGQARRQ